MTNTKKTISLIFRGIACLAIASCSSSEAPQNEISADQVFLGGTVYTVNTEQPWAEAVAVKGGKIIFVGSTKDAEEFIGTATKRLDLSGKFMLPGFQDAHIHPMEGASLATFFGCRLEEISRNDKNPENWIPALRECAKQERPITAVMGGGHDLSDLLALDRMPKEILDEAIPDVPVVLMEKSSHSMWVNSKALELAGITRDTPNSQGGLILKDEKTGEPNGILTDSAGDEMTHKVLAQTPALQQARIEAIEISQDLMASVGITSATNARVYWERGNLEPWLRAEKEGILKQRNFMALWTYPHMEDEYQLEQLKSMKREEKKGSLLQLSQVKFYSDGTISNNSAAMLDPYTHLVYPEAQPLGLNYFTEERMQKYIIELEKTGFDIHVHALGDRAVQETLNAMEAAQKANPELVGLHRHQLTHLAMVASEDISRFGQLGIAANIQINFDDDGGLEVGESFDFAGNSESLITPIIEIDKAGGNVILSSDWDVSYMNPLVSVEIAIEMTQGQWTKEEATAFAIKAYTLNAAHAMHHDDMTGSIEVGKYADLVVLSKNVFETPTAKIREIPVLETYVGGQEIFSIDNLSSVLGRDLIIE